MISFRQRRRQIIDSQKDKYAGLTKIACQQVGLVARQVPTSAVEFASGFAHDSDLDHLKKTEVISRKNEVAHDSRYRVATDHKLLQDLQDPIFKRLTE